MKLRDEKGLAMVELALLLPILLLLVFGITEFGRAYYLKSMLSNYAREGARFASIRPNVTANDPAVSSYIRTNIMRVLPPAAQSSLAITNNAASNHGSDTVTVVLTLPFQTLVPGLGVFNGMTLSGQASALYQ